MAGGTAHVTAHFGRTGAPRPLSADFAVDDRDAMIREAAPTGDADGLAASIPFDDLPAGTLAARIDLPPDSLPFDNEFLYVLRVRDELPVLVVGETASSRFLTTALRPSGEGPEVNRIDPSALASTDLRAFDAVFLVDALPVDGQALLNLEEYVRSGGVVSLWPGDRSDVSAYAGWRILPALPAAVRDIPPPESARLLRLRERADPLFAEFALPSGVVPTIALKRHLAFDTLEPDTTVLLDTDREEPMLLARTVGNGRVFLSALSADRRWSTLPLTALFLPLVHEMSRFAGGFGLPPPALACAEDVPMESCLPGYKESDGLLSPDGMPLAVRAIRTESGDTRFVIDSLAVPGLYLRRVDAASPEPAFAVNAARAESNVEPVAPEEVARLVGIDSLPVARDAADLRRMAVERRRGRPLSESLFWIVLVLAVAEWAMANYSQRRRLNAGT